MVRPEPDQPLDEADIGAERSVEARFGFVLKELLRQRRLAAAFAIGDGGCCWFAASVASDAAHGAPEGLRQSTRFAAFPASACFCARNASFCFAACSARKSNTSRAASPLDGRLAARTPACGRSRSASNAPCGSAAMAAIALPAAPKPNRWSASAAASLPRALTTNPPGTKRVADAHKTIPLWQKLHPKTANSSLFPYISFTSRDRRVRGTTPCGAAIRLVSI